MRAVVSSVLPTSVLAELQLGVTSILDNPADIPPNTCEIRRFGYSNGILEGEVKRRWLREKFSTRTRTLTNGFRHNGEP